MFDGQFSEYYWTSPVRCTVACDQCSFGNGSGYSFLPSTRCASLMQYLSLFCRFVRVAVVLQFTIFFVLHQGLWTGVVCTCTETCICLYVHWLCLPLLWATVWNVFCEFYKFPWHYIYDHDGPLYWSPAALVVQFTSLLESHQKDFCVSVSTCWFQCQFSCLDIYNWLGVALRSSDF